MDQLDFSRIQANSPYTVEEVANGIYLFETDNDVLYVCDTSDGRQRKRSLLFQRWFQEVPVRHR